MYFIEMLCFAVEKIFYRLFSGAIHNAKFQVEN